MFMPILYSAVHHRVHACSVMLISCMTDQCMPATCRHAALCSQAPGHGTEQHVHPASPDDRSLNCADLSDNTKDRRRCDTSPAEGRKNMKKKCFVILLAVYSIRHLNRTKRTKRTKFKYFQKSFSDEIPHFIFRGIFPAPSEPTRPCIPGPSCPQPAPMGSPQCIDTV